MDNSRPSDLAPGLEYKTAMENDHLFPIKVLAWATLLIATISAFATPALSETVAVSDAVRSSVSVPVPVSVSVSVSVPAVSQKPAPFVACLQGDDVADSAACHLIAPAVAISIGVSDGDAVISYLVPSEDGLKVDHRTSVAKDVDDEVAKGELSPEDGAYIFAELLSHNDLGYKIPASEKELKKAVGFAENAEMSPDDQVEIIGSHLQMNLGVSALTADYLVSKLGLQILE